MQPCSRAVPDRHIPTQVMDNFIRRLILPPERKLTNLVHKGDVSADIGCGPGYFTIPMARLVGPAGKVYAVDSDPKSIRVLDSKARAGGFQNVIETHITSGAQMSFIPDSSIDVAFANGLLCCMADHSGAIKEIRRILKPNGLAYLSVTRVFRKKDPRSVHRKEWDRLLADFRIGERGEGLLNRWAIVSPPSLK